MRSYAAVLVGVLAFGSAQPLAKADVALRPAPAHASVIARRALQRDVLAPREREALLAGESVTRPLVFERDGGRYVGGVSYQVVRARPEQVLAAMGSPKDLALMLPRTKSARMVGVGAHGARIELTQGTSLVDATYTVRLRRSGRGEVSFALDRSRPHGIRDVHGFVRARSLGRGQTLVTVAVALDVGPGLVRALFEERIQRLILTTPRHIKDYLEPRTLARAD